PATSVGYPYSLSPLSPRQPPSANTSPSSLFPSVSFISSPLTAGEPPEKTTAPPDAPLHQRNTIDENKNRLSQRSKNDQETSRHCVSSLPLVRSDCFNRQSNPSIYLCSSSTKAPLHAIVAISPAKSEGCFDDSRPLVSDRFDNRIGLRFGRFKVARFALFFIVISRSRIRSLLMMDYQIR
ncbi:hypothetical protein HAX54_033474, partial [Datura stramonium]|nr:hypothetical protein [Datura stramonium]